MIDILSSAPDHLIAVRLRGRLEAEDLQRFTQRLDAALAEREQVNLFIEATSLGGISPQAFLKDVQVGLSQIKNLRRIHRVAVVSDKEWIRTGTEWEDRLLQGTSLRTFEPREQEAALRWASERPPETGPPKRGLKRIPTQDPSVLAFAMRGPITGADIEHIAPMLNAAHDAHGTVNLLMRMEAGYQLRLDVFSEQLAELKTDALAHIERYAVVGAPAWMQSASGLVAPLLKIKVHFFEAEDEAAAWDWVGTAPASGGVAGYLGAPA